MKKHFVKVLERAQGRQPKLLDQQRPREAKDLETIDPASDAVAACRVMAVTATMSCVADAAPGTAEELLPLGTKDLSTALVACRQFGLQTGQKARKRRKTSEKAAASKEVLQEHTWWWHDVACSCLDLLSTACKPSEGAGSEAKPFTDAVEELRDPVANLLDIFEFLSQDSSATTSLRSAFQAAGATRSENSA
ncbi:UGT80B1 [Symbiodinium sp. CCMP2456]|nr:UGT80B1 [Symbiodinium sp. CCMP2456]